MAAAPILSDTSLTAGTRVMYAALTCLATSEDRDLRWRQEVDLAAMVSSGRRQSASEWLMALSKSGYLDVQGEAGSESRLLLLDRELLHARRHGGYRRTDGPDHRELTSSAARGVGPARQIDYDPARQIASGPARQIVGPEQTQVTDPETQKDVAAHAAGAAAGKIDELHDLLDALDFNPDQMLTPLLDAIKTTHGHVRCPASWALAALADKGAASAAIVTELRNESRPCALCGYSDDTSCVICQQTNPYVAAGRLVSWWWLWLVCDWDEKLDEAHAMELLTNECYSNHEAAELIDLLRDAGIMWPGRLLDLRGVGAAQGIVDRAA